jgi:hypothetical protein
MPSRSGQRARDFTSVLSSHPPITEKFWPLATMATLPVYQIIATAPTPATAAVFTPKKMRSSTVTHRGPWKSTSL